MAREGLISDQMAKIALSNPPNPVKMGGAGSVNYAADYVMDVLDDFIGTIDKDIVVSTTLDSNLRPLPRSPSSTNEPKGKIRRKPGRNRIHDA